jgi:hypothetical protein
MDTRHDHQRAAYAAGWHAAFRSVFYGGHYHAEPRWIAHRYVGSAYTDHNNRYQDMDTFRSDVPPGHAIVYGQQ